ncbi:tetratricopeptide repeat protein [Erythrobacter sp.]|uniref:tetratricopeptide repeat protein n=1 Tax=Erythrobacter sp. TaxID=1042 RepID=UPI001B1DE810|nr:tetratricopeptide repeat protein [Erythrobacter sp.]MBO6527043.1 tetratricopeptide repeat protein [Erythrobacter sp.]MBO6528923.1 tetratricopeptide repeat protein [Erythrobacter sp.]
MALTPKKKQSSDDKRSRQANAEQEALVREVDEAVRQSDAEAFLEAWGKPLFGLLIAGLVAFGGYLYWDSRQEAEMERDSEALVGALDQIQAGNLDSGFDRLEELAGKDGAGAAVVAAMVRAGIAEQRGDTEVAASLFQSVAENEDAAPAFRDLARLRGVALNYDDMSSAEVIAALKPLAVPGEPYFASAGELVAHAYLDQGQRAEAGALFAEIAKDDNGPESIRSRARQMAGVLGVDAIEDVDALLEEQGVERDPAEGENAAAMTE